MQRIKPLHLKNQSLACGCRLLFSWLVLFVQLATSACGGDWPTWRYDAQRTAATPDSLPQNLQLLWARQLPLPRPAWPKSQFQLQFDDSCEPIVLGKRMIVGSTVNDSITAYDTDHGTQLWRFYTAGPVRFAPVAWQGKIYAVSDDGYLYCLAAADGRLLWKVQGAPSLRPILGNDRFISTWPARGGPVLAAGVVYFSTGIWPSMGIFIHAVDADTGRILWTNDQMGSKFVVHPHGAPSFGSIVPQGYLVVSGDRLIVPGGRTAPAVFDRHTGQLAHFRYDRRIGDFHVCASSGDGANQEVDKGQYFLAGGRFDLAGGEQIGYARPQVLGDQKTWEMADRKLTVRSLLGPIESKQKKDKRGNPYTEKQFMGEPGWSCTIPPEAPGTLYLRAGHELYTGGKCSTGKQAVARFDVRPLVRARGELRQPVWQHEIDGTVSQMLAADDKLLVVTAEAWVYCFGQRLGDQESATAQNEKRANTHALAARPLAASAKDGWADRAASLLRLDGAAQGYAVALGIGTGRLIEELAKASARPLIAVDTNSNKVASLRQSMDAAGWYGTRVVAQVGDPERFPFPSYLANLIVVEAPGDWDQRHFLRNVYRTLRPYGGVACLRIPVAGQEAFARAVMAAELPNAEVGRHGEFALLTRVGALPGSADWTHQYADAANSSVSRDRLVKAPLGLLWFGGPSNDKVLPRHGHGPTPQVAGGRLFIEGPDMLRAVDVYTGRLLWERNMPRVGSFYNVTSHFSGAGEYGSNYVSLPDHVYIIDGAKILALDTADGEVTREFQIASTDGRPASHWSYLTVWNDLLIATSNPVRLAEAEVQGQRKIFPFRPSNKTAQNGAEQAQPRAQPWIAAEHSSTSRHLVVFDRHTGAQLWNRDAHYSFRHNCLAVASGKIFLIDGLSPEKMKVLRRRGIQDNSKPRLWALEATTGKAIWSTDQYLFGTFLNYSTQHDVLLQGGSHFRDRAKDEARRGLVAYQGEDGRVLWKNLQIAYDGPCLLWQDKIITNGNRGFQLELLTGKRSGWTYRRMYGCNSIVGSEHLLTFRSGAAGFCDLAGDSGTGNLGGFKSSCTSNLIVADGVLNAPDYTRTCTCAYQNQTSLAWVHMPEAELWTFNDRQPAGLPERIGINLGAPGDRRGMEGTLWLEYPPIGGPSPSMDVTIIPEQPAYFSHHGSRLQGDGLKWVAASGAEGIQSLRIAFAAQVPAVDDPAGGKQASRNERAASSMRSCQVRLYFSEPNTEIQPGERTFSVALQGVTVLSDFDIVQAVGGSNRPVVREFTGIRIGTELEIALHPSASSGIALPILCGVEVIAEGS